MTDRKWYLWPQGYFPGYVPWFTILRRLIVYPFIILGLTIAFWAMMICFGPCHAKKVWDLI